MADLDDGVMTAATGHSGTADWSSTSTSGPGVVDELLSDSASSQSVLERFSVGYQSVHGYLSLTVCAFGIVSNALNIAVLTRRSMSNATNCLLTALAVTDLLTMAVYVPYAGYFYCYAQPDPGYGHGYLSIVYLLFNSAFSITAHTVAVWLTVSIAVFRYIVVCGRHSLGARLCSRQRAKVAVGAVVMTTVVFCVPNYIMYRPLALDAASNSYHDASSSNATFEHPPVIDSTVTMVADRRLVSAVSPVDVFDDRVDNVVAIDAVGFATAAARRGAVDAADPTGNSIASPTATDPAAVSPATFWFEENAFITDRYRIVNFWLFGVVLKVVPCVLLTALSGLLVRAMRTADLRRRRLLNAGRRAESDRAGEHNRTTAMLVAVVLCFVATEMPQGVLAFLSGVDDRIFAAVYVPLGDFWDILVLVNSAVNFVVYCKMNRRFRRTVVECFCRILGLERFGFVVVGGTGMAEATTATAAGGGLSSRPPAQTQQHASMMPLYSVVEPSQYTRM